MLPKVPRSFFRRDGGGTFQKAIAIMGLTEAANKLPPLESQTPLPSDLGSDLAIDRPRSTYFKYD